MDANKNNSDFVAKDVLLISLKQEKKAKNCIEKEKFDFLIKNGYCPSKEKKLSVFDYDALSSEDKKQYIPTVAGEDDDPGYYKKDDFTEFSDDELKMLVLLTYDKKLSLIDKRVKIIKNCILFSTIMFIISAFIIMLHTLLGLESM